MKIKILVIFFLALIFSFIIYDVTLTNRKSILMLGDNHLTNNEYKTYDKYLYDDLKNDVVFFNELFTLDKNNYKDILNDIKNNKYVVSKNKKIYLNQLISKSNIIILNANNEEYFNKCNKSDSILKEYDKKIYDDLNNLINVINKISTAKIIIIGNYCINKDNNNLNKLYKNYNYINMFDLTKNKENISSFKTFKLSNNGNYELYKSVKLLQND
ncbi:MAG: hypothetical protein MR938_06695 [Tenericutes bacterium]|nr:hypothetical protein [Mycoplasmatota bacterium]